MGSSLRDWCESLSVAADHHFAAVAGDLLFFLGGDDLNLLRSEAQPIQALSGGGTNALAVFADAAGEDQKVGAAKKGEVGSYRLSNGERKNIERKSGFGIVVAGAFFERLHVAVARGKREKAALMIQQVFKLVGAEFFLAQKINENARVEVARSCGHGNASGWSEAHCGVDGFPVAERAKARSIAEVREDGPLGKLRAEVMH